MALLAIWNFDQRRRVDKTMDKTTGLLNLDEAARYLGVSKTSLRRWTNEGRLECHRIGVRRERRFDIHMLNDFLALGNADPSEAPDSGVALVDQLGEFVRMGAQRHVCLFYHDAEEQWELFRPYLLDHIQGGHPTVYICDSSSEVDFLQRLRAEGVDDREALKSGLLRVRSSQDTYLKTKAFSADLMLETMRNFAQDLISEGSKRQLLVGEMSWFFTESPGVAEIHDYESRLNELLDEMPSVTIVCHYDTTRFSAQDALQACCSHPVVQLGQRLLPGFYSESQPSI
jgi:excisionase family DNA binding protein